MAAFVDRATSSRRLGRDEKGAEAVEFALVAPLLFFLVGGLFYLMILFAAQVSLGYATNVAVRYAAIPTDISGTAYPSNSDVLAKVAGSTPFFSESSCVPTVTATGANRPVSLTVDCDFPNPAGRMANAFRQVLFGGDVIPSTVELSATAQSRRE